MWGVTCNSGEGLLFRSGRVPGPPRSRCQDTFNLPREAGETGECTMPNTKHLKLLNHGVEAWNAWRKAEPSVVPDLTAADLKGANLNNADLSGANLHRANLHEASLVEAKLCGAVLSVAYLAGADLH